MPNVILRGRKDGHRIARLVLEGSSSNPIRYGALNGVPFEVTDEELVVLEDRYVLELADGQPDNSIEPPPEPEVGEDDDDNQEDET